MKILQHSVAAGEMFRHDRVGAWYRPLLSLGEALFLPPPPSLGPCVEPPCRESSVELGEECAGMRSSTDCRKSTQQLAQYGQQWSISTPQWVLLSILARVRSCCGASPRSRCILLWLQRRARLFYGVFSLQSASGARKCSRTLTTNCCVDPVVTLALK